MLNLRMTRARTAVFGLTVTQSSVALDLTGKRLVFTVKRGLSDLDAVAVFQKSSAALGIVIDAGTAGTATLTINPADTAGLPLNDYQRLFCELVLVDGGNVYELDAGTLAVIGNVTFNP